MDRSLLNQEAGFVIVAILAIVLPCAWKIWKALLGAFYCCPQCHSSDVDEGTSTYNEFAESWVFPLTCRVCGKKYERSIPIATTTTSGGFFP